MTTRRKASPREAKTFEELCALPRDNVSTDDHWIITDGHTVTIATQRNGEVATAMVGLPRATFEAFIDWYNTGRFRKPGKRRVAKPARS